MIKVLFANLGNWSKKLEKVEEKEKNGFIFANCLVLRDTCNLCDLEFPIKLLLSNVLH